VTGVQTCALPISTAWILTPFHADEELIAGISRKIRAIAGRPADISVAEKADLIAGLQFKIDDLLYDMSVKGMLDGLRRRLAGT
jgi:F0F1-type ATP synthase delta subunit